MFEFVYTGQSDFYNAGYTPTSSLQERNPKPCCNTLYACGVVMGSGQTNAGNRMTQRHPQHWKEGTMSYRRFTIATLGLLVPGLNKGTVTTTVFVNNIRHIGAN